MIFRFEFFTVLFSLAINNVAIIFGVIPKSAYPYNIQGGVLVFTAGAFFIRRSRDIRWFGASLEATHPANIMATKALVALVMIPPVFFSLSPWVILILKKFGID